MESLQRRVGSRIREVRKEQLLTQAELAEKCDIAESHVGAIERGERWPSPAMLARIDEALNVLARDLFPGQASGGKAQLVDRADAILGGLTEKKLKAAIEMLGALKKS